MIDSPNNHAHHKHLNQDFLLLMNRGSRQHFHLTKGIKVVIVHQKQRRSLKHHLKYTHLLKRQLSSSDSQLNLPLKEPLAHLASHRQFFQHKAGLRHQYFVKNFSRSIQCLYLLYTYLLTTSVQQFQQHTQQHKMTQNYLSTNLMQLK